MGQCLGLVAKSPKSAAEEAVDGSAPQLDLAAVAGGSAHDSIPRVPESRAMLPSQAELIERHRELLVSKTTQINLERVLLELAHLVPTEAAVRFKNEDHDLAHRLTEFFTFLPQLKVANGDPFYIIVQAFYKVECFEVCKILQDEVAKPKRKSSTLTGGPDDNTNGNEQTDFELDSGLNPNAAGDTLTVMTPDEARLILDNMQRLINSTSMANLNKVITALHDHIPLDIKTKLQDEKVDLTARLRIFYNFVPSMRAEKPFIKLVSAFAIAENPTVDKILRGHFPKPLPKPLTQARVFNVPSQMYTSMPKMKEDLGDVNVVDVNFLEPIDRENFRAKRICVKPAKVRLDHLANRNRDGTSERAYKCGSNPKGLALILNIFKYEETHLRHGSQFDRKDIEALFDQLGYNTIIYPKDVNQTVTKEDVQEQIKLFSSRLDHFHMDSMFMVIMAHGEEIDTGGRGNAIITSDNKSLPITWIKEQFTAQNCPALIGKPKVFIYQACRGSSKPSITMNHFPSPVRTTSGSASVDGLGSMAEEEKPEPKFERLMDDMLVCHASPLGHVAHRDEKAGAFFIQAIIDIFSKNAHDTHIRNMMDEVDNVIREQCIKKTIKGSQTTCIESIGFTKKLFINPGLYDDDDEDEDEEQEGAAAAASAS